MSSRLPTEWALLVRAFRDRQVPPRDLVVMQARAREGWCPFCARGPWRLLAGHTAKAHGIERRELRDVLDMPWSAVLCEPELRRNQSDRQKRAVAEGKVRPPLRTLGDQQGWRNPQVRRDHLLIARLRRITRERRMGFFCRFCFAWVCRVRSSGSAPTTCGQPGCLVQMRSARAAKSRQTLGPERSREIAANASRVSRAARS